MPKFEVRVLFEFAPGQINGAPEEPPADLLDEKGKLFTPLGIWPQQNAKLEAANPDDAIAKLMDKWKSESQPIFLDERITRDRFTQLENRPRPGQEDCNSVVACWQARQFGRADWNTSYQHFRP
jgi:hypothetical protein